MKKNKENEKYEEYYLSIKESLGTYCIYSSEKFKLDEHDLLVLIRITIRDRRNKTLGEKLMKIYLDSTKDRQELTLERLNRIGVKHEGNIEPEKSRKPNTR